jgi:hypothetical protein
VSSRSEISDGIYDSGLDGSSGEDDSGSEDELDLHADIPVTGFAVASYKRNADFHDLFSSIPEGDYLIEGEWWIVNIWITGTDYVALFRRLWMCIAARDFDTRPALHLGKSYMLPC